MGSLGDSREISRERRRVGAAEIPHAPRTRHGTKLRDMLMSDKAKLSYADFHHEITSNPDDPVHKYVGSQQSQVLGSRNLKEDELVRYMSNLPSYLERGKDLQEKALSVGVLDWRRLEKWRFNQKQRPHNHSGGSPSSSNTSLFSSDGSSSRGQSCSPAHQKLRRHSLQSPLEVTPRQCHVEDAKSSPVPESQTRKVYAGAARPHEIEVFAGNTQKFQDSAVTAAGNYLDKQRKLFGVEQLCEQESDLKSVSDMGKRPASVKYEAAAPWKGKANVLGKESARETRMLQETNINPADQGCSAREKSEVVLARDPSGRGCSDFSSSSKFEVNDRLSLKPLEKSLLVRSSAEDSLPPRDVSCKLVEPTLPSRNGGIRSSSLAPHVSLHSTKMLQSPPRVGNGAQGVKGSSQASHLPSFPARMFGSPSRIRNSVEKKPVAGIQSSTAAKPSEQLDGRKISESILKPRHPSPMRRLSFAMGKMMKGAGSRDNSPQRSSSIDCVATSGHEGPSSAVSMNNHCSDKSSTNNNNRGRSSPLRRLLDPLLKPRASNSSEISKKYSSSVAGTLKSCNDPSDRRSGHSAEAKKRSSNSSAACASDILHIPKNGPSSLQALLQISFKNDLPLFTFAIDNESDILAATVRKSIVPGKRHHYWTYTFFTVREVKRKSGKWLNPGVKGDGLSYIPNVVAQMKVSDAHSLSFDKHRKTDDLITREFHLFAVDTGEGDPTDFHPTDELAAIVVKLPRTTAEYNKDDQSSYNWLDFSQPSMGEKVQIPRPESNADSGDNLQYQHSQVNSNISTTVILPGGVHTVPSKGELSTLAQRWRSGGLCDCGGWDLGCQLRVYSSKNENARSTDSAFICRNKHKLQLFSQVGQDTQPILSLAPFKERIYSVEFDSALSLLQAFAISISFIDCRRPLELSEPNNIVEKVNDEVGVYEVPIRPKVSNQVEAPGRYVSYPPHSPVGRV